MLHWINWIVLLSLEPLAGELKYASVVWSAAGRGMGRLGLQCLIMPFDGVHAPQSLRFGLVVHATADPI
jgi:hypothetical protein